jgi:AGZA family xanthine/uracil permease-like MFS transporter
MDANAVSHSIDQIAGAVPSLNFDKLFNGLDGISPLLATAIPLGIYNFTEAMSNVESAAAAGDSYNLRSVLLADGTGAVVGSCLGSPFPPAVYVGHPGWKAAGGRMSYSLATGVLIFVLCAFGLFPLLGAILPVPAIVPILLYIGLVIGAQAFRAVPRAHYAAVVLALVPNVAAWGSGLVDNSLAAAGTSSGKVGEKALEGAGVIYNGLLHLGQGAVLAGILLGAIAVFMIDRKFLWGAAYCGIGAVLASVGLIHGEKVHVFVGGTIWLGYAFMGVICLAFYYLKVPQRAVDADDPMDLEVAVESAGTTLPPAPVAQPVQVPA